MSIRFSVQVILAGLLFAPVHALAQAAATAPQQVPVLKTIGQPGPGVVPSLIVINARGASLQGQKLTLTGVAPNAIVFADRPIRAAGHDLIMRLLEAWSPNGNAGSFATDPPNATVSAFSKDGSSIRDAVVVLKAPKLDDDRLTFDVDVLEGDLTGADGAAAIFIDRFGFGGFHAGGFHAGGFHAGGFGGGFGRVDVSHVGVNRVGWGHVGGWDHVGYHGAWYGGAALGAAAVGTAAVGAAAAGAAAANAYGAYGPFGPLYGASACGYYPYPPCY
jgi:hypothetical protein